MSKTKNKVEQRKKIRIFKDAVKDALYRNLPEHVRMFIGIVFVRTSYTITVITSSHHVGYKRSENVVHNDDILPDPYHVGDKLGTLLSCEFRSFFNLPRTTPKISLHQHEGMDENI